MMLFPSVFLLWGSTLRGMVSLTTAQWAWSLKMQACICSMKNAENISPPWKDKAQKINKKEAVQY